MRPHIEAIRLPLARMASRGGVAALRALVLALALFVTQAAPASAAEVIQSFVTNTILLTNGTVDVTETIEVNVERDQVNHGIYRDIFTVLVNDDNSRLRSNLTVLGVLKDGRPEPYTIENLGTNAKRIRIGDGDIWLDRRAYKYTIHYTMTRMGRTFADHDELFWNATGNYWAFPILRTTATIQLPPAAIVSDSIGYTGALGSRNEDVSISQTAPNTVTFRTLGPLPPGEGLSVAVKFQKGILSEPTGLDALGYWLSDHRDLIFPTIAVLLVLLYNFMAWSAVGRDPAKGTIIPRFHPPKNFSPAVAHYVSNMGFKQSGWTAFTASIFDLGVKGLIEISKVGKSLEIKVIGRKSDPLPSGEAGIFSYFNSKGRLTIDKSNGAKINEKKSEFVATIERENRQTYFKNNVAYVLVGVALSAFLLFALVWLEVLAPVFIIVAIVASIAVGILASVMSGANTAGIFGKIMAVIWISVFGFNFLGGAVGFLSGIQLDTGLIGAISIIAINVVFAVLMRAPTIQGRRVMDELDGFKMYMDTAEKNRLNMTGEPPMTIKRFEAILPFAIALGVEKPWSQHFEAELARNAVSDATGSYSPMWYSGSDWSSSSSGFSNTVSSVASGMSAAMIAAQPVSSSSSGFSGGGGGGSGGGGGGGGGGGW